MDKNKKDKIIKNIVMVLAIIAITLPLVFLYIKSIEPKEIKYNSFIKMAKNNEIKEVKINFEKSHFTFKDFKNNEFKTDNPKSEDFKKFLLKQDIKVKELDQNKALLNTLASLLTTIISMALMLVIVRMVLNETVGTSEFEYTAEDVDITFKDIAGNEEAKEDMKFLVEFLKEPKKYVEMGAKLPKGVILYGSPGTGKTLTAKAIAGEASVPFYNVIGSDFVEMYAGLGAKRVRSLFEEAKKNSPCIIFIDEIDALGTTRGNDNHSEKDQTINALLAEMDGFKSSEGVIVLAATNRVEDLDRALIRPGRFDRHIAIDLPDYKERLAILKLHSQNKKIDSKICFEDLAKMTIGFSGAGLASLLNEATIIAVNRGSDTVENIDIDEAHFKMLVKGNKKKNYERSEKETKLIAYHEGGHALLGKLLTDNDIPKVTIIPSTSGVGGATFNIPKKMHLLSRKDIKNEIITLYGGRAAEHILQGNIDYVTTGASNDIERATQLIYQYFNNYGMSEKYGLVNISQIKKGEILEDVVKMSKDLYEIAYNTLYENRNILDKIALSLIEKETITGEELDYIIKSNQ